MKKQIDARIKLDEPDDYSIENGQTQLDKVDEFDLQIYTWIDGGKHKPLYPICTRI